MARNWASYSLNQVWHPWLSLAIELIKGINYGSMHPLSVQLLILTPFESSISNIVIYIYTLIKTKQNKQTLPGAVFTEIT